MAVPLGVLAAIYLNEYGGQRPPRARDPVHVRRDDRRAVDRDGPVRRDDLGERRAPPGFSTFAGALALACLMLPIVIRSSEEMLKLVPDDLRQASDALGARRWRTVLRVVLPAALAGHRQRRHARGRAGRGRDRAAPLHDRRSSRTFNTEPSTARTPRCRCEIWSNAQQPFPRRSTARGAPRSTLIVIVFVLTVIARHRGGALLDAAALSAAQSAQLSGSSPRSHSRMRCSRSASRATRSRLRRNCGS